MSSYRCSETVLLPAGVSPGLVIGKGGATVRDLSAKTGARFAVDANNLKVVVSGKPQAVRNGVDSLIALFADNKLRSQRQGSAHWRPQGAVYLLDQSYGMAGDEIEAVAADGDVCRATERPQAMFNIVPCQQSTSDRRDDVSDVMAVLAGAQIDKAAAGSSPFLLAAGGGQQQAVDKLLAAVHGGCTSQPPFDELKLRFNFGQALFFKGISEGQRMSIKQLQALRVPTTLNSVFSNGVDRSNAATMVQRLQRACPGLLLVGTKDTVSLHLEHTASKEFYALSLTKEEGSDALELRKVKSNAHKLFFLSLLSPAAGRLDCRLKLIGQHHSSEAGGSDSELSSSQLMDIADGCSLAGWGHLSAASLAYMQQLGYHLDKARFKSKSIYQGSLGLPSGGEISVKVSISSVRSHGSSGGHTEVAGSCPELNAELADVLAAGSGRLDGRTAARLKMMVEALLGFARAVSAAQV